MEFKQLFIGMIMVAMLVIGVFMFAINTQSNYNVQEPIANDSKLAFYNNLTNSIGGIGNNSNSSQTGFYSSPPSVDSGGLMLTTIVTSGQILTKTIQLTFDIILGGEASVLGLPLWFTALLNALIVGVIILLIWSLIRLGR